MADSYQGAMSPRDLAGDYNSQLFVMTQLINKISTSTLVKIVNCTNSGGLSSVGFVDVEPLVKLSDGQGKPIEHGIIYNLPYFRLQGGASAIIIDPEVGDIGLAVFASKDISTVKKTKSKALPASARRFDMSDGLYIGGFLNGAPTQYLQYNSAGITLLTQNTLQITGNAAVNVNSTNNVTVTCVDANITCSNDVNVECSTAIVNASFSAELHTQVAILDATDHTDITSPNVNITGNVIVTGTITSTGTITAPQAVIGGKTFTTHKHSGVTTGGGNTGNPV